MEQTQEKKTSNSMRRLARLAAVQGLYQLALSPEPVTRLVARFRADPAVLLQEEQSTAAVDVDMFGQIVTGVSANEAALDAMISGAIDARLSADRIEPLLRAILRAGIYELQHRPETPSGVIVNDYIDVAHGFFDAKEPGLVNAVLDKLAKTLRAA